ncbi:hypothetical protein ACKWTF_014195 [Chironomus riparius]
MKNFHDYFEPENISFNLSNFYLSYRPYQRYPVPTWPTFPEIPKFRPIPTYRTFPTFTYPSFKDIFITIQPPEPEEEPPNIPSMILIIAAIVFAWWNFYRLNCKSRQYVDIEAGTNHRQQTQSRSMDVAYLISETSGHASSNLPIAFTSSSPCDPQSLQPEINQETIPSYENPPNYEEAMKMIEQQKQELNSLSNPVDATSSEESSNNINQP